MGSIKRIRRKYQTPSHPWQKERIPVEKELLKEYGLKNKKELWKMSSKLARFKVVAKQYISLRTKQSDKQSEDLLRKLRALGLLNETSMLNDILTLSDKDILERRLQTILFRKATARSVSQARQFISHGHITINGMKITSPSYLVRKSEEEGIAFVANSALADNQHPERTPIVKKPVVVKEGEEKGSDKYARGKYRKDGRGRPGERRGRGKPTPDRNKDGHANKKK